MSELTRREALALTGVAGTTGVAGLAGRVPATDGDRGGTATDRSGPADLQSDPEPYQDYAVRRVPEDHDSIQRAVEAAEPRDLVSVGPGVYREAVEVLDTPHITIRGRDRNEVILDGEHTRQNGVTVTVDGVVVENVTARNYGYNGFFWTGVTGYRGSYLTAYNNAEYGVYAFASTRGRFEHSYASGHPDSGFYVGQCDPCHAVVTDVVAERNAIGYSGTNAGGDLHVRNSVWRDNMAGIVPNTLDSEDLAPQAGATIEDNLVADNDNVDAPTLAIGYPVFGTGIAVPGGTDNVVRNNEVRDHANFGVLLGPIIDKNLWRPAGNEVRENVVRQSGRADLALAMPAGPDNCFADNAFATSRPARIEGRFGCDGGGGSLVPRLADLWPTLVMGRNYLQTELAGMGLGSYPAGDHRDVSAPGDRPTMPDPEAPPRPPVAGVRAER